MLNKICNRVGLPVLIMNNRTVDVRLKKSDRNHFLARYRRPNTKPTFSILTTNKGPPFVGLDKLKAFTIVKNIPSNSLASL
jgi:hypothetical protein